MIRPARAEDLTAMLAIYAPYVLTTTYSFEYEVPSPEAFADRFESITRQLPWLVWEEDGRVLGYAYASLPFARAAYRWCAEPSIYLIPEAQGKGIGRKLYTALEKILQLQGYQVLYAIVTAENRSSLLFHRAMGYEFLAHFPRTGFKFDRWLGITWLEKRLFSVEFPSEPPKSWHLIVKDDRKFQEVLDKMSLS